MKYDRKTAENAKKIWKKIENSKYIQFGKLDQKVIICISFSFMIIKTHIKNNEKIHSNEASYRQRDHN